MAEPKDMYQCQTVNCGCIYDPDRGDRRGRIPKGTHIDQTPEDWHCPVCGASKKMFQTAGRSWFGQRRPPSIGVDNHRLFP